MTTKQWVLWVGCVGAIAMGCGGGEARCPDGTARSGGACVAVDAGGAGDAGGADAGGTDAGGADAATADAGTPPADGCTPATWYADADGDGFGDPEVTMEACAAPDGYVADGTDCDDACDACHPEGTEVCDGADNDCDGETDEDVTSTFHRDADGDGFGDPDVAMEACEAPDGYVSDDSDCDDDCTSCRPGGTEVCDGRDNDCDLNVDEGVTTRYYPDCDGDGYAASSEDWADACTEPGPASGCAGGWTTRQPLTSTRSASNTTWDCDDNHDEVHPGATAWHTTAIPGAPSGSEFDYDCDGDTSERHGTATRCCLSGGCCNAGWIGSAPDCGDSAAYGYCTTFMGMCGEGVGSTTLQQECR